MMFELRKSVREKTIDELLVACDHMIKNLSHYKHRIPRYYREIEEYVAPNYFRHIEELEHREEPIYGRMYRILWDTLQQQELGGNDIPITGIAKEAKQ